MVKLNDEIIKERDFVFHIGQDIWEMLMAKVSGIFKGDSNLTWFALGGFLLVIAAILTIFHKKSKIVSASK